MALMNSRSIIRTISVPESKQFHSDSLKKSSNFDVKFLIDRNLQQNCFSISYRNRRNRKLTRCCCSGSDNEDDVRESLSEWDWNRWSRHFHDIERAERFLSLLKFQLQEAIEKEDFLEAAKLKKAIAETVPKDCVTEIMAQLKDAIDQERYHDASLLSRCSGSGLVGWWAGWSNDSSDPFGRLVRITPELGRFVGRSYTPRQLVTASPGTLLFEIFVIKDADKTYLMQVVYLQRAKQSSINSPSKSTKVSSTASTLDAENETVVNIQENEGKIMKSDKKGKNLEEATEEGIKNVMNFLKEKIPGLKVEVMNIDISEEVTNDSDPVTELIHEGEYQSETDENSEGEADDLEKNKLEEFALGGGSGKMEEEKNLDIKLFIGGVLHKNEDATAKDKYVRVPAEIRDVERDSFVLRLPESSKDHDSEESKVSRLKVAAIQGISELMPSDVAKAFLKFERVSSKVSKDVREIVKLAISQAQKQNKLSEYTNFNRISTSNTGLDPFEGLYVGAYGPYGPEVVQLRRKFGYWNDNDNEKPSDVEFFEYVEAVKLTGDLNVPAGKVTFRAKIGKGNRAPNRGLYPDELGVVGSYKGQGRIAEFGYREPRWVGGQLLQLSGKGMGPFVTGADLGFLYVDPEQSFLVLFNRLTLPD